MDESVYISNEVTPHLKHPPMSDTQIELRKESPLPVIHAEDMPRSAFPASVTQSLGVLKDGDNERILLIGMCKGCPMYQTYEEVRDVHEGNVFTGYYVVGQETVTVTRCILADPKQHCINAHAVYRLPRKYYISRYDDDWNIITEEADRESIEEYRRERSEDCRQLADKQGEPARLFAGEPYEA